MTNSWAPAAEAPVEPGGLSVHAFPSSDPLFRAFVTSCLDHAGTLTTLALQDQLRTRYPLAVVRAQDALARRGDGPLLWYAFRFGSILGDPSLHVPVDWDDPEVAEAVVDDERRFLTVNDALVTIVEVPREKIVGRSLEDFTNPGDPTIREDLAALWAEFVRSRVAESTIRYNRRDGTPRQLAWRIVADDPEPGHHRLKVRELVAR